jgi:hypothetical protein
MNREKRGEIKHINRQTQLKEDTVFTLRPINFEM